MDVLYRKESATAAEVMESLPDPPSYSAVRALLRILEQKGHICHEEKAGKYVFMPTMRRDQAMSSAEGENAAFAAAIVFGWIRVLPSKPSSRPCRHDSANPSSSACTR